ncbi:MAG: DUF2461 domain-containing protein [Acidimicrobiales bacterium]
MSFTGWPVEAIEFYEGLEADNSKAYWQEHKAIYEHAVKAPMEALLADLAGEFGEPKVFRPNRDVRFSADKSPYKTAIAAVLSGGGYIQLSSSGLGVGTGMYVMASDQLDRFRQAIDDDKAGAELTRIVAAARKRAIEISAHEALKTAPKGYPKDHPRAELLRLKGLIAWRQWDVAPWFDTAAAKTKIAQFLRSARPINDWLETNVGPSTLPPGRWG